MDKHVGYVMVVYIVTLVLLFGYLTWLWLRLKAVKNERPLEEVR